MSQLMLVNPKKRSARKTKRTAAQRAATKRMIAANRSRSRSGKSRSTKRRRNPVAALAANPAKRRRRRNPSALLKPGKLGDLLVGGLKGAVGSVAINAVTSYLPPQLSTGNVIYATRAGMALMIGTFGKKIGIGAHARQMAEGALAVNFADLINATAGAMLPGSTLHGVGGVGEYLSMYQAPAIPTARNSGMNEMGEYVS